MGQRRWPGLCQASHPMGIRQIQISLHLYRGCRKGLSTHPAPCSAGPHAPPTHPDPYPAWCLGTRLALFDPFGIADAPSVL